ncbi:hypothetical protein DOTSEDRAFT_57674 [Dothistroma septosporum NZE10]|uniref:Uncharacterized protein n=1 Tax=Dothistroma septosporum (strain NZE10 / CBS 128990) TaxID=675120 RepID=M2YHY5_DOTSN|nr:hypothetical protein DOTSEDRAFT_57674 [Dothistroma septosporum NZE10]
MVTDLHWHRLGLCIETVLSSVVMRPLGESSFRGLEQRALGFEMAIDDGAVISSWHEMLIAQPPITAVLFRCYKDGESYKLPMYEHFYPRSRCFHVWNPAGVRFVDLALALRKFVLRQAGRDEWEIQICLDLTGGAVEGSEASEMKLECGECFSKREECECSGVVSEKEIA